DDPSLRRSLNRCLKERGIPLAESRDPTALRWDENLKWAFSPLKVVSSRYETLSVRSYLSYFDLDLLRKSQNWIAEYGIRKDLKNYNCPQLKSLYENLLILEESFGRRMTLEEISSKQLEFLNRYSESIDSHQLELFVFLEKFWKSFQTDLKALGLERKKAPVGWWLERVGDRLDQMGALVDLIKPTHGVQIYRFSQVPFWSNREKIKNLYFLGFSSRWLSGDSVADYGMNDREKDLLSSEFNVTSTFRVIEQRMLILDQWLDLSEQVTFLDSHYAWDGKEKESLHATFQEWPSVNVLETKHYGTHSRWKKSFSGLMKKQENNLKLTPLVKEEVRATELDRYSRCLFQGLAAYRWNLRDVRHAEEELWPDVLGNLLHACVEILLLNRTDQGTFTKSLNEVIEEAQSRVRIKGWMKNRLTDHALIRKIKKILEVFCEKEKEYVLRSGTAVFQLEDQNSLSLQIGKTRVYGRPDRIDSHPDGLFVIDYKTSSQLPAGVEMIEDHYRLQLPFYALAAPLQYQRPVIGAQLIQLNSSGNRNHGIFYKKWNDKKEGLTHTRSKKNVFEEEPEFIWSRAYEAIEHTLKEMESGMYSAVPRKEIECRSCVYSDLCGKRRQRVDLDE
ncbi:MAG: hypothetical protein CL678_03770, partial [Bdellovibrionaceae bacterium]|nr:hypothetical protein [Pseudobdellovibrionaceae bacterium]